MPFLLRAALALVSGLSSLAAIVLVLSPAALGPPKHRLLGRITILLASALLSTLADALDVSFQ